MRDAGAVYFTDADRSITDSKLFRRVLSYAKGFGAAVAHRPADPGSPPARSPPRASSPRAWGWPAPPPWPSGSCWSATSPWPRLTGAHLIVDQITTADALDSLKRARDRGVRVTASASINHLSFNELDIGDYRTFARLDPPLRAEADRQALIEALLSGR